MPVLSFAAAGLICNILGAIILMRTLAFGSIAGNLTPVLNASEQLRRLLHDRCAQKLDVQLGGSFLVFGFLLHLFGVLGMREKPIVLFLVLTLVALITLYYSLMRDLIATNAAEAITAEQRREMPKLIEARAEVAMLATNPQAVEANGA